MRHIPADILHTFPASNGRDVWEVRKSNYDGKVYCTCPGWIFKARKTTGICKHIAQYLELMKKQTPGATIAVYTYDEYQKVLALHRDMPDFKDVKMTGKELNLDR